MAWFTIAPDFDEDGIENWLLPVSNFVTPSSDLQQKPQRSKSPCHQPGLGFWKGEVAEEALHQLQGNWDHSSSDKIVDSHECSPFPTLSQYWGKVLECRRNPWLICYCDLLTKQEDQPFSFTIFSSSISNNTEEPSC